MLPQAFDVRIHGASIDAWSAGGASTYVPWSMERLAAWRYRVDRFAAWAASVRPSIQYRRLFAGELSREQLALLVAASWSGPARYTVTQPRQTVKARRTVKRAARVWRVMRRCTLEE